MAGLEASGDPARLLAKRFAAKEAFAKASGQGLRAPVTLARAGGHHDALGRLAGHLPMNWPNG